MENAYVFPPLPLSPFPFFLLPSAAGVDDGSGLALEFRTPRFRRFVALLVARGAEHAGDQAVTFLSVKKPLKTSRQELSPCFADVCVADTLCGRGAAAAANDDRVLPLLPFAKPRFVLAGTGVAEGRA